MYQSYSVHLEKFDGPLDLLLHLIRKHELDICDIPIADITKLEVDAIADAYVEDYCALDPVSAARPLDEGRGVGEPGRCRLASARRNNGLRGRGSRDAVQVAGAWSGA